VCLLDPYHTIQKLFFYCLKSAHTFLPHILKTQMKTPNISSYFPSFFLFFPFQVFIPSQRAQILTDSFELSVAGMLDIWLPLNLSRYLVKETDYLPWNTAYKNFVYIDLFMQTSPDYDLFKVKFYEQH
jgi:hypothetical protein